MTFLSGKSYCIPQMLAASLTGSTRIFHSLPQKSLPTILLILSHSLHSLLHRFHPQLLLGSTNSLTDSPRYLPRFSSATHSLSIAAIAPCTDPPQPLQPLHSRPHGFYTPFPWLPTDPHSLSIISKPHIQIPRHSQPPSQLPQSPQPLSQFSHSPSILQSLHSLSLARRWDRVSFPLCSPDQPSSFCSKTYLTPVCQWLLHYLLTEH